ncbi:MAG TPA: cobalamin biosynthesis protein [Candidatus Bathyarchaeia archaeon]|nr:cobalamin biosynthesis protein [Candidatus Bathyarchaeia archaeon]
MDFSFLFESAAILALALLIDAVFGEVPDRFHPTVWMGNVIAYLKPRIRSGNSLVEKVNGVLLCIGVSALFAAPVLLIAYFTRLWLGPIPYVVVSAVLLKFTFALNCMGHYTLPIAEALERGDLDGGKRWLHFIVRRDPASLDEQHVVSAAVESIAESTTDGVTSSLFFFGLFGVAGAFVFRVVNTLDSMVGYRDAANVNIGWFSAKLDTVLNYVPARLTGALMVLASMLLGECWRDSWRIMLRDKRNMVSINAGWTIGAMAGALGVQLEKLGVYKLGDEGELIPAHIRRALRIMAITVILFSITIVIPIFLLEALLFGIMGY